METEQQLSFLETLIPGATIQAKTYGVNNKWIRDRMDEGCRCPLCNQYVRRYKRSLNGTMARVLIFIYRYYQTHAYTSYLHVEGMLKRLNVSSAMRADFHKLAHWKFLEKHNEPRKDGCKRNGHYRITPLGQLFVKGAITAKKYVLIYNEEVYGFEGPDIRITDCFKDTFNYDTIMMEAPKYL